MNKATFLKLLGQAYDFPEYYTNNLDSADEILEDFKEKEQLNHLSLRPLLDLLLTEAQEEEKAQIWSLIQDHFSVQ